jgi:ribosomal-protein-alanine N-acetyltransferase
MQLHRREPDPLFDVFPVLRTERCILRRLTLNDAPALYSMLSDAELARFTPRKPLQRVGDAVDLIRSVGLDFATRRSVRWGVCLEPDGPIVATVGLHDWDRYHRHVSIGFDVDREHWGEGLGHEVVSAVVQFAYDHLYVHRFEAYVMRGNQKSERLLSSVGFRKEGELRQRMYKNGHQYDVMVYAMLRSQDEE